MLPVVVALVATGLAFVILVRSNDTANAIPYLAAITIIASISWTDDIFHVSNYTRLLIQLSCAAVVIVTYGAWESVSVPFSGNFWLGTMGIPVTIVWIIGLTNAFNFMDGIDGIAAGQGLVASVGWTIYGILSSDALVACIGVTLVAGTAAFVFYNWSPAKIFMGDVGSATLGFIFACLTLLSPSHSPRVPLFGLLLVWPFVFDASFTFIRRALQHENVFQAHKSHIYQRLVLQGLSHATVSSIYIVLAGIGLVASICWISNVRAGDYLIICVAFAAFVLPFLPSLMRWRFFRPG